MIHKISPNQNDRKNNAKPSMLILHYTGTRTAQEADEIYMTPDKVSPHYMLDRDGTITHYVDEAMRSWHAGLSSWAGDKDINSSSIGIEVVNGGHEFGLEEFPVIQMDALIGLINDIRSRWAIPDHRILGHSDIAPGRKIDPGEKFPWAQLQTAGIGLMPNAQGSLNTSLAQGLKDFGYDYVDDVDLLKREFTRHYLPHLFGQASDEQIEQALGSILSQI